MISDLSYWINVKYYGNIKMYIMVTLKCILYVQFISDTYMKCKYIYYVPNTYIL